MGVMSHLSWESTARFLPDFSGAKILLRILRLEEAKELCSIYSSHLTMTSKITKITKNSQRTAKSVCSWVTRGARFGMNRRPAAPGAFVVSAHSSAPRTRTPQTSGVAQVCSGALLGMPPQEPKGGSRQPDGAKVRLSWGCPGIWHRWQVHPTEEDAQPQPQRVAVKMEQAGLRTTSCEPGNVESECHHLCRWANPVRGVADLQGHFKSSRADSSQALASEPCCADLVLGVVHQLTLLVLLLRTPWLPPLEMKCRKV